MSKPQQQILWTLLPNGIHDGTMRFSVVASPHLVNPPDQPDLKLAAYRDLLNWPATLRDRIRFSVAFDNGTRFSEPASGERARPDGDLRRVSATPQVHDLWEEMFKPDGCPVNRPAPAIDTPKPLLATYSASRILSMAKAEYPITLASATGPAQNNHFLKIMSMPSGPPAIFQSIRDRIQAIGQGASPLFGLKPAQTPTMALFEPADGYTDQEWHLGLALFYREGLLPPRTESPAAAETLDEFHAKVATLGSYPWLMRQLGLTIDFELPVRLLSTVPPSGRAAIQTTWTPSPEVDSQNQTPWTSYLLDSATNLFQAAPRSGTPSGAAYPFDGQYYYGMLNLSLQALDQPCFRIDQIDPVAEAAKLNVYLQSQETDPVERNKLLNTPRPAGLTLSEDCRADGFAGKVAAAAGNQQALVQSDPAGVTLYAEDLNRGYRVDIQHDGKWRSLCRRKGEYALRNGKALFHEDEGWLSTTVPANSDGSGMLLVSPTLTRWEGWSLVAPRPGGRIPSVTAPAQPPGDSALRVTFSPADHSLPRLRYGWQYRVRIRLADLAGNGLDHDDPRADHWRAILPAPNAPPFAFRRFEPLLAPDFVAAKAPDESLGEGVFKMVIRSEYNQLSEASDSRHAAPPKAAEILAEMHGKFDRRSGLDEHTYETIVKLDHSAPPVFAGPHYHPPYLSDPLAGAVMLHGIPGLQGGSLELPFFGERDRWPFVKPWRIRIMEDPDGPEQPGSESPHYREPAVDERSGLLTIYLPKAEVCTVRANSRLSESDLDVMGIWRWIEESYPQNAAMFRQMILRGDHWMFTPSRTILLVHAVDRPLFPPRFDRDTAEKALPAEQCLVVTRGAGDSFARLESKMFVPGRSAAKLSLFAKWIEWFDDGLPATDFPKTPAAAHAFDMALDARDAVVAFNGQQEFGDTKHRYVTYNALAATRFQDYVASPGVQTSRAVSVHIPSSAAPPTPEVLYCIPTFGWEPQTRNGDEICKTRRGGGVRVYLNRPWFRSGEDELLGVVISTAGAPAIPKVSQWGRDPLSSQAGPGVLAEADFLGRIPYRKTISGSAGDVLVLGHEVRYDRNRKSWFADVIVDPHDSYFPFIKLALVRFQPYSVDSLHVSTVVWSEFAQLAPGRVASLTLDPSAPGHAVRLRLGGKGLVSHNRVEAAVERARRDTPGDAGWEPVAAPPSSMTFQTGPGGPYWECNEIAVPFGTGPLRVMIREFESYVSDAGTGERLVYAGAIGL